MIQNKSFDKSVERHPAYGFEEYYDARKEHRESRQSTRQLELTRCETAAPKRDGPVQMALANNEKQVSKDSSRREMEAEAGHALRTAIQSDSSLKI